MGHWRKGSRIWPPRLLWPLVMRCCGEGGEPDPPAALAVVLVQEAQGGGRDIDLAAARAVKFVRAALALGEGTRAWAARLWWPLSVRLGGTRTWPPRLLWRSSTQCGVGKDKDLAPALSKFLVGAALPLDEGSEGLAASITVELVSGC